MGRYHGSRTPGAKAAIGILLIEENHDTRVERLDRDIGFALDVLRDIVDGEE
jgi:hypothetical protein